jgi:hypothetical protein
MGCSGIDIGIGGGSAPNDARPTTNPLVQGAFTSQNGKTVTGTAAIFNVGTSSYILRLEGISTPVESGLQVQLYNSASQNNFSLKDYTGSQNYAFTNSNSNVIFSSVAIYSTLTNMSYGSALLK